MREGNCRPTRAHEQRARRRASKPRCAPCPKGDSRNEPDRPASSAPQIEQATSTRNGETSRGSATWSAKSRRS